MHVANTYKLKDGRKLRIIQDESPQSPREWDNNGWMVCLHTRYDLGDKHDYRSEDHAGWGALKAQIEKDHDVVVILPLYLFDHSGLSIRTTSDQFSMCDCRLGLGTSRFHRRHPRKPGEGRAQGR